MPAVCGMYAMKPVYDTVDVTDLPTCMHKVKNIHQSSHAPTPAELLLERQAKIIDELERLQSVITSLTEEAPVRNIKKGTRMQTRTLLKPVNLPRELVIGCNPSFESTAIIGLIKNLQQKTSALCSFYVHSSCCSVAPCTDLSQHGFISHTRTVPRSAQQMVVTWIWKNCDDVEVCVSPLRQVKITGETNVCRYLSRLAGEYVADPLAQTQIDDWLDQASAAGTKCTVQLSAQLSQRLAKNQWLVGTAQSLADRVLCSLVRRSGNGKWNSDKNITSWASRTD